MAEPVLTFKWAKIDSDLPGKLHAPQMNGDVGWDIEVSEDTEIKPGEALDVPTNIQVELPYGTWGEIRARSSIARRGLQVDAGTIDNGYRGPLYALVRNMSSPKAATDLADYDLWLALNTQVLVAGTRVAQVVLHPVLVIPGGAEECLNIRTDTHRGEDGFGSTGE